MGYCNSTLRVSFILLMVGLCLMSVEGLITRHHFRHSRRHSQQLDSFVFLPGGLASITITNGKKAVPESVSMGLVVAITKSNRVVHSFLDSRCPLSSKVLADYNNRTSSIKYLSFKWNGEATQFTEDITRSTQGIWSFYWVVCGLGNSTYYADVELVLSNVEIDGTWNYLSAGDIPKPWMILVSCMLFIALLCAWIWILLQPDREYNIVHIIIAFLLVLKVLATFTQSLMYFSMSSTGEPKGWNIAFYIFQSVRGIIMFVTILMIGTGWQFVKAHLNDQDKLWFIIVVPLQVITNIGLVVCEELKIWGLIYLFFHILDLVCCLLVLLPIARNIQSLSSVSNSDDKIKKLVEKLKRLRHFYIIVFAYIYTTRIMGSLLVSILPPDSAWVSSFIVDLATISFYIITGYEFRPTRGNVLFELRESESSVLTLKDQDT